MTYSSGSTILATDYNGFASTTVGANVNAIYNTAYNQGSVATVSVGGTVTATQWATLNNTITTLANHQGTSITSRTSPVAGNTIAILSNLNTDITSLNTNKYNAYASGAQNIGWTGTASKTTATGSGGTTWTITFTDTVTFANANAATYFWNCGGLVKIQFSKTSTGTDSDADWNTFVNSTCANAVYISADSTVKTIGALASVGGTFKTGGTGTPTTILANTGWNQLTSTPVTVYKQFDTVYTYTGDYVQVNASANTTALVLTKIGRAHV